MGKRILIVDASGEQVRTVAFHLRSCGHRVEYGTSVLYAMHVAERFSPELVLLDQGLPASAAQKCRLHFAGAQVAELTRPIDLAAIERLAQ